MVASRPRTEQQNAGTRQASLHRIPYRVIYGVAIHNANIQNSLESGFRWPPPPATTFLQVFLYLCLVMLNVVN